MWMPLIRQILVDKMVHGTLVMLEKRCITISQSDFRVLHPPPKNRNPVLVCKRQQTGNTY